jgi:hypothetical protein
MLPSPLLPSAPPQPSALLLFSDSPRRRGATVPPEAPLVAHQPRVVMNSSIVQHARGHGDTFQVVIFFILIGNLNCYEYSRG